MRPIKKEILYPNGFVAISENDNIELWVIRILSPLHQSIFRYFRIITQDGNAIVYIKSRFIQEETGASRMKIIECVNRLRQYNMITANKCGRMGLEIEIMPINEWHKPKKKKDEESLLHPYSVKPQL